MECNYKSCAYIGPSINIVEVIKSGRLRRARHATRREYF
jgi:hypothetical protein